MADAVTAQDSAVLEDQHLRRTMGLWQLTAVGFSGVIGSGWLLGAMYAANAAGPEAIIGWVVGGGALMLIAYVMPSISAAAFTRAADVGVAAVRTIAGVRYLAPAAFVLASLIVYWAGWTNLREALPVLLVGAVVYGYQQCRAGGRLVRRPGRHLACRLPDRDPHRLRDRQQGLRRHWGDPRAVGLGHRRDHRGDRLRARRPGRRPLPGRSSGTRALPGHPG
jgi:hypothetical protein